MHLKSNPVSESGIGINIRTVLQITPLNLVRMNPPIVSVGVRWSFATTGLSTLGTIPTQRKGRNLNCGLRFVLLDQAASS